MITKQAGLVAIITIMVSVSSNRNSHGNSNHDNNIWKHECRKESNAEQYVKGEKKIKHKY